MKQLIDLCPGIIFFIAYFATKDFVFATYALVLASACQLVITWAIWRKIEKMHLVVFLLLLPMAALTILLKDDIYIKWKPSVVNLVFAAVFGFCHFFGKKSLAQRSIEGILNTLPEPINLDVPRHRWYRLNAFVILFFLLIAALNAYVAHFYSNDVWVTFKVFGLLIINICGMVMLMVYLSKHIVKEKPADSTEPTTPANLTPTNTSSSSTDNQDPTNTG